MAQRNGESLHEKGLPKRIGQSTVSTMHTKTANQIKSLLNEHLEPKTLTVINESDKHKEHKGARENPKAGHFKVYIESSLFNELNMIKRHQKVYGILKALIPSKIHALSLTCKSA